jgi:hypothetical protein
METLSDWFPKDVTPVHVGAYQVRREPNGHQFAVWFSWWNGERWSLTAQTAERAELLRLTRSYEADRDGGFEWRGILKPIDSAK